MNQILISFILYFSALLMIGFYFYKKNRTEQSFLIANRSLNYWVTAIAAQTSDMGSWLFLGYPAVVFSNGLIESWTAISLVLFMYLNWKFIAPKIRRETEKYKCLTLSDYFSKKVGDVSGTIGFLSALISIYFFTLYLCSGFVGLGRLFEPAFNISFYNGVIIGTVVTVAYILVGGFFAVAWCNLFQGIFLLAMIILVPAAALYNLGGISTIGPILHAKNISLSLIPQTGSIFTIILLTFAWGLGYFGQPHILINFMSIKNEDEIGKATRVGMTWQILVLLAATAIGIIGIAYFNEISINPEHVFVNMVRDLFPDIIAGFALCAILAAALSTINTQLVVSAGSFAQDIYPKLTGQQISNKKQMLITRLATIIIALIAMLISFANTTTIYNLVYYAWAGLGSAFGPLLISCLYAKSITKAAAISGLLTGTILAAIWPFLNLPIPTLVVGFFGSLLTILIVNKIR